MRTLIIAQGHPSLGDLAEPLAAHDLFTELRARAGNTAWFLGCGHGAAGVELRGPISQPFGPADYIYNSTATDPFRHANRDPFFPAAFTALLTHLQPDEIHFFGFARIGIDSIAIARRAAPTARILLTLTDFAAICAHDGWMLTREQSATGVPCHAASLPACGRCFPERGPTALYLRERYIRHFLDQADLLIAPTEFCRARYLAWGVPQARIVTAPYTLAPPPADLPRHTPDGLLRVGFFGAPGRPQGLDVLLQAARLLDEAKDRVVRLVLHTRPPDRATPDHASKAALAQAALAQANPATPDSRLIWQPLNDPASLAPALRRLDAVVIPSLWWESGPLIAARARQNFIPVLCGDTGAMAESVKDTQDGFHFTTADPVSLADLLLRLAALPYLLTELPIPRPKSPST